MKKITLILLAAIAFLQVNAQKLPNVQQKSLRAPTTIEIDGKATEWNDKYQAYNNATDINYTLSNDDKNLYLLIKVTGKMIIGGKILAGGISFTANHTSNKKDANAITVTYPLAKGNDWGTLGELFYGASGMKVGGASGGSNSLDRLNKAFTEKSKYIGVTGIKSVAENELPIYNNLNIQSVGAFHAPAVYLYELAIPLEILALPERGTKPFSYHIKMNVRARKPLVVVNLNAPPEPDPDPNFITPTDFWGEYTLAK